MPYSNPIGALDSIDRQMRRVRLRRNFHTLQRTSYRAIAATAVAAALLLVSALFASATSFALTAWSAGACVAAILAVIWWQSRRSWLTSAATPAWIDRHANLHGRLLTVVATSDGHDASRAGFVPLLIHQTLQERAAWTPSRLVPRAVPIGALAGALAAVAAVLLVIALAPRFQPHVPEIVYSEEPVAGGDDHDATFDGVPDRVVVAPSAHGGAPKENASGAALPSQGDDGGSSAMARLPGALQERIRDQLWGDAWTRARDALARAQHDPGTAADPRASARNRDDAINRDGAIDGERETDRDGDDAWDDAETMPSRPARGARRGRGSATQSLQGSGGARAQSGAAAGDGETENDELANGAGGSSAGNGTDPNLYGTPSNAAAEGGTDTFELGIAARVRGRRGAPGPLPGEAPAADADTRPALAAGQRAETAVHHMTVPPAYEDLVREVFAHRGGDGS